MGGGALGLGGGAAGGMIGGQPPAASGTGQRVPPARPRAEEDPGAAAETALKKLRQDPTNKEAAEALDRALRRLKEQGKPK
jgi:hypothetical protein